MYTPDAHDEPIPISIFSYSRLLRDGLPSLLNPHIRIQLIGSYAGEFRPRHDYPNPPCHVVLLDSGIGREDASAWTHWWRQREPAASVLILELEDDKDIIFACIEQGASGYTVKESAPSEVAACIYQASRGAALCSPEMTAYLFARVATLKAAQPPAKPATPLTNRELEVLHCISKGYSNKEIASALHIELHTVKHHVHNILEKLDLRHRHEAARVAADQGWFALSVQTYRPSSIRYGRGITISLLFCLIGDLILILFASINRSSMDFPDPLPPVRCNNAREMA